MDRIYFLACRLPTLFKISNRIKIGESILSTIHNDGVCEIRRLGGGIHFDLVLRNGFDLFTCSAALFRIYVVLQADSV